MPARLGLMSEGESFLVIHVGIYVTGPSGRTVELGEQEQLRCPGSSRHGQGYWISPPFFIVALAATYVNDKVEIIVR